MDIIKAEIEHGELHQQGLCKCSYAFTDEDRERLANQYQKRNKKAKSWWPMNREANGVEPKLLGGSMAASQLLLTEEPLSNGMKQEITYQEWKSGPPDYTPLAYQHVQPATHVPMAHQQFNPQAQAFNPQAPDFNQYNSVSMAHQNFNLHIQEPGPQTPASQIYQIPGGQLLADVAAAIGSY